MFIALETCFETKAIHATVQSSSLVLVGLLIILLGVLLYVPTTEIGSPFRTLYFSSIGGALVLVGLLHGLEKRIRSRHITNVGICVLVGLGSLQLMNQHRSAQAQSDSQRYIAEKISSVAKIDLQTRHILVIDQSPQRDLARLFGSSWYFEAAVQIAYDDYEIIAALCYPDQQRWGGFNEYCIVGEDSFSVVLSHIGSSIEFMDKAKR